MNKTQRIKALAGYSRQLSGKVIFRYCGSKYTANNVVSIDFTEFGVNYCTSTTEVFSGGRSVITETEHFVPWDDIKELEIVTLYGISKERIILHS